jgi:hypothetical protein
VYRVEFSWYVISSTLSCIHRSKRVFFLVVVHRVSCSERSAWPLHRPVAPSTRAVLCL